VIDAAPAARFRVALVAACDFPSPRGSQALIAGLANALAKRGHIVHVVAYCGNGRDLIDAAVTIHYARRSSRSAIAPGPNLSRLVNDLHLTSALRRVVREQRIDVLHAHNYEGAMAASIVRAMTGKPVVYHAHNVMRDELELYARSGPSRWLARVAGSALDRTVPRSADFAIALTEQVAAFLRRCGVSDRRLEVVPPVISELPGPVPIADPELAGKFVVAYAGNLDPYQDLDVLARGFGEFARRADDAMLLIVTHESRWQERVGIELHELVDSGRARVVVATDAQMTQSYLRSADVLMSPRSSWSGYPMKLFNYLAAGKPVVAGRRVGQGDRRRRKRPGVRRSSVDRIGDGPGAAAPGCGITRPARAGRPGAFPADVRCQRQYDGD